MIHESSSSWKQHFFLVNDLMPKKTNQNIPLFPKIKHIRLLYTPEKKTWTVYFIFTNKHVHWLPSMVFLISK